MSRRAEVLHLEAKLRSDPSNLVISSEGGSTSSSREVGCVAVTAMTKCSSGNGLRRSCQENALRMQYAAVMGPAKRCTK